MKNRRLVVAAFLLIAVICIGTAYAAVTDLLDIQGAANVSAANVNSSFDDGIYFSDATAEKTGDTATVSSTNDKATFSANGLTVKGDTASFTFTIKNENKYAANVVPRLTSNTTATHFAVTSEWEDGTAGTAGFDVAAESEVEYTVTVELKEPVTAAIGTSITIELTATADEEA